MNKSEKLLELTEKATQKPRTRTLLQIFLDDIEERRKRLDPSVYRRKSTKKE